MFLNPPPREIPEVELCASRNLRRGKHRLLLWPGVEADGSLETSTPSKLATQDEMGRLEKVNSSALSPILDAVKDHCYENSS